jgi:hypothetical protein
MRSIASTAKRAIEQREAEHLFMPPEEIAERLGMGDYHIVSAEQELEDERIREALAKRIAQLAAKSERHARLIDGIGFNLRGRQLADFVGVTPEELPTLRRSLKREARKIGRRLRCCWAGSNLLLRNYRTVSLNRISA